MKRIYPGRFPTEQQLDDSFERRLSENVIAEPYSGCWLWTGFCNRRGYGVTSRRRKLILAHRAFYQRYNGEIPSNLEIDHLCRTPSCVNPRHLEAVSHRLNCQRGLVGWSRKIIAPRPTHCIAGHAFDNDNTYWYWNRNRKKLIRQCKACKRRRVKDFRAKISVQQQTMKGN